MNPILLSTPFASSGDKNTIPESESSQPQNATWEKGFPPITQTPISEGGIPPERNDFNGTLNAITQNIVFQTQGGRYKFDPTYANKIGGYPVNAVLQLENGAEVINKTPNNTTNPNVDMTGWETIEPKNIIKTVESIEDLMALTGMADGDVVYVEGYHKPTNLALAQPYIGGGLVLYVESASSVNDGVCCFGGWTRPHSDFVTFAQGGAIGNGSTTDWAALSRTIRYGFENGVIVDGEGMAYLSSSMYMNSNLHLRNVKFVNTVHDKNLISVLTTDTDPNTWFENVIFENVHIDGMRQLATGLPSGAFDEDGGRHGFRIVKKCRNIKFINSGADNCAVDGLMLFAKNSVSLPTWNHFVRDIEFLGDCHFNGNGRWGVSADSVYGMRFGDGFQGKGNGLDLTVNPDITTGLSGRKDGGYNYGGAVDIEEYKGVSYSKNVIFGAVDMRDNAAGSVNFTRTGILSEGVPTHNVWFLDGGLYNEGVSTNKPSASYSIRLGGYSMQAAKDAYREIHVGSVDLGGGSLRLHGADSSSVTKLLNVAHIYLELTVLNIDRKYKTTLLDGYSNYIVSDALTLDKSNYWIGSDTNPTTLNFKTDSEKTVSIRTYYNGKQSGGIGFRKETTGDETVFYSGGFERVVIGKYGTYQPMDDNIANVGSDAQRINTIYLGRAPVVSSDARLKSNVRDISKQELQAARDILREIKLYKMSKSKKWHIGIIAQMLPPIFKSNGLDISDYEFYVNNAENDTYAIIYEQLQMFLLSALIQAD